MQIHPKMIKANNELFQLVEFETHSDLITAWKLAGAAQCFNQN